MHRYLDTMVCEFIFLPCPKLRQNNLDHINVLLFKDTTAIKTQESWRTSQRNSCTAFDVDHFLNRMRRCRQVYWGALTYRKQKLYKWELEKCDRTRQCLSCVEVILDWCRKFGTWQNLRKKTTMQWREKTLVINLYRKKWRRRELIT